MWFSDRPWSDASAFLPNNQGTLSGWASRVQGQHCVFPSFSRSLAAVRCPEPRAAGDGRGRLEPPKRPVLFFKCFSSDSCVKVFACQRPLLSLLPDLFSTDETPVRDVWRSPAPGKAGCRRRVRTSSGQPCHPCPLGQCPRASDRALACGACISHLSMDLTWL